MPTYEYKCNKCEAVYVLTRSVDERSQEVKCVCGEVAERVFNVPGIKFNGTGFYSTGG